MILTFNSNIESMREFLGEATLGKLKIYGGHCPLATPWFCLHKPKCEKVLALCLLAPCLFE